MKSHTLAAAIVAAVMISSPVFAPTASAQPAGTGGSSTSYLVPVVIGAAAGATVGALLWPAMAPAAGAAMAGPAAAEMGGGFKTGISKNRRILFILWINRVTLENSASIFFCMLFSFFKKLNC